MNLDKILEQIKAVAEQEIGYGNTTESNVRLTNGELLWGSLALLGYGYSQVRGTQEEDSDPSDFWPFGEFKPSDTARENLIRACQMIIFEIDRLDNTN